MHARQRKTHLQEHKKEHHYYISCKRTDCTKKCWHAVSVATGEFHSVSMLRLVNFQIKSREPTPQPTHMA